MSGPIHVLVLNATPHEHAATRRHLEQAAFSRLRVHSVLTEPGKINAAFSLTSAVLSMLARGESPSFVVGAGTSGSLSRSLKSGDMVASSRTVISDWQMLTENGTCYGPYGTLDFKPLAETDIERLAISCADPLVDRLMERLPAPDFVRGAMLTSDSFVTGLDTKLDFGRKFDCLACDMESGAFAHVAGDKFGLPWFNLRVVADSLEEDFSHYQMMEEEMTEILGRRLRAALEILDSLCNGA